MSDFTIEDLFNYRRKGAGGLVDAYEQLQQRIAELEAQLPKWISVDERLPEYPDEVLCITSSDVCHICKFCQLSRLWMKGISCERMYTVTHWMPIPKPPKEQGDE